MGRDVALSTQPHLAPRLKKEKSYTSAPPLGLHCMWKGELYFLCPVTFNLFRPNILLSALFSKTLSLCSSLYMTDQDSHPYKTAKIRGIFRSVLKSSSPLNTEGCFSGREVTAAWSWPLTFIQNRDKECVELYHHSTKRILNFIFLSTVTNLTLRSPLRCKPFILIIFRCGQYLMTKQKFYRGSHVMLIRVKHYTVLLSSA